MATIRPFAALRPKPELASRICELPYDVMSSDEAVALAAGNPLSFLHVSKPEIDLPRSTDPYAPAVYETGRRNFRALIKQGALRQDPQPCFYLYRQVMGRHSQTGLVAVSSCEEYLAGTIKKHEFTRPDKEDDRVRHIEALGAQTGPVFLVYRADPVLAEFMARRTDASPEIDFTAADGVRHTAWVIRNPPELELLQARLSAAGPTYIADGHHRCAAAARVFNSLNGRGQSGWFLSVLFPHDQVRILPYNRVLQDWNGLTPEHALAELARVFCIAETSLSTPAQKHELSLYARGAWRILRFRPEFLEASDPAGNLDVTLLQKHVLAPIFGIEDPRTSKRIQFVGGIRGTDELVQLVDSGEHSCAFSMFPTSLDDLMAIADQDGIMPPKSTWFEPKLRDAMFCHLL